MTTLHTERRPPLAVEAWRDAEFWGPEGLGCSLCHEGMPVVVGLPFGALCDRCLERCLPGWDFDRIVEWLGRQRTALLRKAERAAVFEAARKGNLRLAMEYERKYGIWLPDRPHP